MVRMSAADMSLPACCCIARLMLCMSAVATEMFCILHHKVGRKVYWPQRPVEAVNAIHYRP